MPNTPPRRLIPVGPTDELDRDQLQRVQALAVASRLIPSGNRTAHNVTVMANYILGDRRR